MELRQIRYFVVTAEEGNISRAAERLHVSQPALSQQLRELEAEFGFDLFERVARGVRLLPAGEAFLASARRVLAEVEEAGRRARAAHRGEAGCLRIAFNIVSGRQRLVGEALHRYRERWPNVALELVELNSNEQPDAFREGRIDVGFLYRQGEDEDLLAFHLLREDPCMLALSRFHALAQAAGVAPAQLRNEPFVWLARSVNAPLHDTLLSFLHAHGIVPNVVQHAGSAASQLNLVSVGMGVALVVQVPGLFTPEDVRFVPVDGLDVRLPFCLAHRRDDLSPLVANFRAVVAAVAAEHEAQ